MSESFANLQTGRWDAKNSFVEVVAVPNIDKIRIGFRQYDKTQAEGERVSFCIDYYMKNTVANAFSQIILSGAVKSRKTKWEQEGCPDENKTNFFEATPGGTEINGETVWRVVRILPGRTGYRIAGFQAPGKRDEKGLITPAGTPRFVAVPLSPIDLCSFAKAVERAVSINDMHRYFEWRAVEKNRNR